jgi:NADH:ubiquinone oxidoreductase subunit 5 (subunit L)/multisubunit Na+/H+ antiporter MnhA subunit
MGQSFNASRHHLGHALSKALLFMCNQSIKANR